MRAIVVLGMSAGLLLPAAALAAPAGASAPASTTPAAAAAQASPMQSFTGAGLGTFNGWRERQDYDGSYVSNGQLGNGRFHFATGIVDSNAITFTRSDGTSVQGPMVRVDCHGVPATECDTVDLVGTSDITAGQVLIYFDFSTPPNAPAYSGNVGFFMQGTLTLKRTLGYAMVDAKGAVYRFGGIDHLGDAPTSSATDLELTPSHAGYWIVNASGQVYAFGDAPYLGNADASAFLPGERVTSLSATPSGKGYWLFTTKGRVLTFGDATSFGDLHDKPLNGAVVGSIATPTGRGYYMVGSDGGVFAFGDAKFRGSMGAVRLNQPVVGLTPTADNAGYWLVASDGGVFSFDAPFHGSMGAVRLNRPIVTLVPYVGSYLMIASDGGIFNFSKGPFFGSEGGAHIPAPIVNGAATG